MGIFLKRAVKSSLDKGKVTKSYIITALFVVLIALNVAAFTFFPRAVSSLAIILSNVVTVLLMLFAIQPINTLIQNELTKKAEALSEQGRAERELRDKVVDLENRNHELESRLDTWTQTATAPSNLNFTFKVETMTYDKTGYIVKEEPLEKFLKDPSYKLPDKKDFFDRVATWVDDLAHPGEKKVLYIGKYYVKASIGLDFSKIKYSTDGGALTLFGVKFSKLNDLAIERDADDVNHCWLLNDSGDGVSINQSEMYRDFTDEYARMRSQEADEALSGEVEGLCEHYTAVFRDNLAARFPGIKFCDHIEDSDATWYSLKEHFHDQRIAAVASNMFLMADVLSGYIDSDVKALEQ